MKILRDPCSSFQYNDKDLDIQLFFLSLYCKITITLRSHVVVLSVTRSCGYPRGDVRLILDGWLVEEYRVLRDSMLHEVSTPLFVTHQYKFKSQVRVILLQYQVHHIGFSPSVVTTSSRQNDNGVGNELAERSRKERNDVYSHQFGPRSSQTYGVC